MQDFTVHSFQNFIGPNFYLDRQALVINLLLAPEGPEVDHYRDAVLEKFPVLDAQFPDRVAELYAQVLIQVMKMDIDLFVNKYAVHGDGDDVLVAVEYLDNLIARNCAEFVADWLRALNGDQPFDFDGGFEKLQGEFDATVFGGPTIYSLIEAGLKRNIPVLFLYEENVFMWGYGKRHVRGRSTTFHTDSIKDTEFTTFKDMVKDFLLMCGFPTPSGSNTFTADAAVAEAHEQGFPVVVKPLAGHKGQGVTTGIKSDAEVRTAFGRILESCREEGVSFDGAIVEKEIYGTDHRLLTVNGKFVAALERVPAYVDGDGSGTISELIAAENDTVVRLDNARSPLCKINIDDDLREYLQLQDLSLEYVPKEGERVFLRRVANISAGGVSINVTDKMHPKNVKMVEDIAKYIEVGILGIDVLAQDIAKPWDEGSFGIIEINAGPGVFMHLAPAIGESIDVPGTVMEGHFPAPAHGRVPIIAGNRIDTGLAGGIHLLLEGVRPGLEFGALTADGIHFNGGYFHKNKHHDDNVKLLLRNPKLDAALFSHTADQIDDYGMVHQGADLVILEEPAGQEAILRRDLLPGGWLVEAGEGRAVMTRDGEEVGRLSFEEAGGRDAALLDLVGRVAPELLRKYD
jgi:cyanophycin synthetase